MLIIDKHCCDGCCDEFPVWHIDCNVKHVKEQWHGKFYLQSVWRKLVILNTDNIKICGWITKLQAIKMQFVCIFSYLLNICRKFEFLISQGSVATCLRWGGHCRMGFVANFIRYPAVQKFWKSVKVWQNYREFTGGNFFAPVSQQNIFCLRIFRARSENLMVWKVFPIIRMFPTREWYSYCENSRPFTQWNCPMS